MHEIPFINATCNAEKPDDSDMSDRTPEQDMASAIQRLRIK